MALVSRMRQACSAAAQSRSTIERADREEAISQWLERHSVDEGHAATLVDTALSLQDFDELASSLDGNTLRLVVQWLAADCSIRTLAAELERASTRIHDLVAAIKRFTYMDRTMVPEAIDLAVSLNDSVALLMHKARRKSVEVTLAIEPGLPRVLAIGGDLNQVWTNVIDNAIDAVDEGGSVAVSAARHLAYVIVSVLDDGAGIPDDIRPRIFDPFFTTKPVGQGTGLGLDISQRLIRRNGGDIDVQSRPGRTEFRVTLPIAPATQE
jgi:signal transduction histidine kinase